MGLFGSKAPVTCAVCGKETGTADNKKHKAKDGVVCQDCFLASGLPPNGWAGGITVAEFKEQLRSADGLTIIDRQKQRLSGEISAMKQQLADRKHPKVPTPEGFEESRTVGPLHIDDKNQKWFAVLLGPLGAPGPSSPVYAFSEIDGCDIDEDGTTTQAIKKGGVGRALVGGALFGGVGAIVGASTGKGTATTKSTVDRLSVRVQLADGAGSVDIPIIVLSTSTDSAVYKSGLDTAKNIVSAVDGMVRASSREQAVDTATPPASTADELRSFKQLLDEGILTQEEFDAKKKQLLGCSDTATYCGPPKKFN